MDYTQSGARTDLSPSTSSSLFATKPNIQAAAKVILSQIRILTSTPTSARKLHVTDVYGPGAHTLAGDAMVQTIFSGLHGLSAGARVWDGVLDGSPGFEAFGCIREHGPRASRTALAFCGRGGMCDDPEYVFCCILGHTNKEGQPAHGGLSSRRCTRAASEGRARTHGVGVCCYEFEAPTVSINRRDNLRTKGRQEGRSVFHHLLPDELRTMPSPPLRLLLFRISVNILSLLVADAYAHLGRRGGALKLTSPTQDSVAECGTAQFTWEGGEPPFTVLLSFQANNSVFQRFWNIMGTSMSWQATIPTGNDLGILLMDGNMDEDEGYLAIQPGKDGACLLVQPTATSVTRTVATNIDLSDTNSPSSRVQTLTIGSSSTQTAASLSLTGPASSSPPRSTTNSSFIAPITTSSSPFSTSSPSRLSTAAIGGIVAGGLSGCAVCLALTCFLFKLKRKTARAVTAYESTVDLCRSNRSSSYSSDASSSACANPENDLIGAQTREQTNSSLVARASSTSSCPSYNWAQRSSPYPTNNNRDAVPETLSQKSPFRDTTARPVSVSDRPDAEERGRTEAPTEDDMLYNTEDYEGSNIPPRYGMDEGRRLAGGRPGESEEGEGDSFNIWRSSSSNGSTLPPPYSSLFGEMC